jgi:L-rhamnose isomerase
MGHYHPTETIHDKISSYLQFHPRLLLHVSRPIRWDSDHVVLFNDDVKQVFLEIQRGGAWGRVAVATDYFDASINRLAAYTVGLRATRKAILYAMLDPTKQLQSLEAAGDRTSRMALMDEMKAMPFGSVWAECCRRAGVPQDLRWMDGVKRYEARVLSRR